MTRLVSYAGSCCLLLLGTVASDVPREPASCSNVAVEHEVTQAVRPRMALLQKKEASMHTGLMLGHPRQQVTKGEVDVPRMSHHENSVKKRQENSSSVTTSREQVDETQRISLENKTDHAQAAHLEKNATASKDGSSNHSGSNHSGLPIFWIHNDTGLHASPRVQSLICAWVLCIASVVVLAAFLKLWFSASSPLANLVAIRGQRKNMDKFFPDVTIERVSGAKWWKAAQCQSAN